MTRSQTGHIFAGIAAGLGRLTPISAWIWRFLLILFTVWTLGVGVLLYLMLWWILPADSLQERTYGSPLRFLLALLIVIVVVGGVFARDSLVSETGHDLYVPAMVFLTGLVFLLRQVANRRNVVMGLVVAGVTCIFLLGALGALPDGLYDFILRSLPGVLVFGGLSLLLRDRIAIGNMLALILTLALIGGIAFVAFSSRTEQVLTENTIAIEQAIDAEVTTLVLDVSIGQTDIEFRSATDDTPIITGEYTGSLANTIEQAYTAEGQIGTLVIRETLSDPFPKLESIGRGTMFIELPQELAVFIEFSGDNGDAIFNTGELNLERLVINLQSGDAILTLPTYNPLSPSASQDPGNINIFNGNLTLRVNDDLGIQFILSKSTNSFPVFEDLLYRVEDSGSIWTLEPRNLASLDFNIRYTVAVPNGTVELSVLE